MLHYFCVQGSRDIAGYLGSDFWSTTVLQASHAEPAVRQALVSLSALHLDYVTGSPSNEGMGDILRLHGKALRALRKRVEEPSPDATRAALVCCVLFYCFESTLGNSETAMHHLQGGLNLMSHHYGKTETHGVPRESPELETLSAVFERLDLQASMFDDGRQPALSLAQGTLASDLLEDSMSPFLQAEHAYDSLIKLHNWLFQFLAKHRAFKNTREESIPTAILQGKLHLKDQLNRWKSRLEEFNRRSEHSTQTTCAIQVLLILWRVSCMLLDAGFPANESIFGASPNTEAREVINLASSVLEATRERNASATVIKSPRRNFSSETGVVAPLFILAMKCSDEWVCDRAVELLSASQRREGLYDSQAMAAIVQQFRAAREETFAISDEGQQATNAPLEILFADGIDRASGCMDRKADFIKAYVSSPPNAYMYI